MARTTIAASFVAALTLLSPVFAFADQLSDLLAQLAALQQQLSGLQGGTPPTLTQQPSTVTSGGYCPNLSRTLQYGMRGDDVGELQQFLIIQGLLDADSVSGFFGKMTERAVQTFQVTNQIVSGGLRDVTGFGVVGRKTRTAIQVVCSGGRFVATPIMPPAVPYNPPVVNPPPVTYTNVAESLLASPMSGGAPLYVSITAKLSCDPARSYQLAFGDGATGTVPPPGGNCSSPREYTVNHAYSPAGTYTLSLVANGDAVARTNINVSNVKPSCNINSSVTQVGAGTDFVLNWNSSNASTAFLSPIQTKEVTVNGATTTKGISEGLAVYTLNVSGPGGTASCSTSVTIQSPIASRDAQRLSDLQKISGALRAYREGHGSYPDTNGWINDCSIQSTAWIPGLATMPKDPIDNCVWPYATTTQSSTATYAYFSDDGSVFALAARLENSASPYTIHNAQSLWFDGLSLENTYGWNRNATIVTSASVATTSSLSAAQRDALRISDLDKIVGALKSYYTAKGRYPTTAGNWVADCEVSGANWIPDMQLSAGQRYTWNSGILDTMPRDPVDICEDAFMISSSSAATYGYWSDNGTRFALVSRLETSSHPKTLANRSAQLWFDGLSLLDDYKWNNNTYVVLASGAIASAQDSIANLASALAGARSILERLLESFGQ